MAPGREPLIFNIQRFSIHDGPGIRTTVFFKGCPLRCVWCHNPESQSYGAEQMYFPERCVRCGRCAEGCQAGVRETVGKAYTARELCAILVRDRMFYERSGGGVTLSGGEPMAQDADYLCEVAERLARSGIELCVDTCGYAPYGRFAAFLPYVDAFLYDVKAVDARLHLRGTGVPNDMILDNLRRLSGDGARIFIRVPVIPGFNAQEAEMGRISAFVRDGVRAERIYLLPYHRLGSDKAERLESRTGTGTVPQLGIADLSEPSAEALEAARAVWLAAGFTDVQIGG